MKPFTIVILQIITIFFLCKFDAVKSENNRKWLEIGKDLYRVEPEGKYTWKQAVAECQKERSNLISPKGAYDYAKLKAAIKHNFKHYSSFWTNTQVKWASIFQQIGLGKDSQHQQKCNKFDNSSTFKYLPDDCDKQLGFICEKPLLEEYTSFKTKNTLYYVEPYKQFTCEQSYIQCEKREMSLVVLPFYQKNDLLKDYVFLNYGSNVSFWFGFNNETHYNCATPKRGQTIKHDSRLGFICQRSYVKSPALSMRHLVLIIFLATAAIISIIIYAFARCLCTRKREMVFVPEVCYPEEVKFTNFK